METRARKKRRTAQSPNPAIKSSVTPTGNLHDNRSISPTTSVSSPSPLIHITSGNDQSFAEPRYDFRVCIDLGTTFTSVAFSIPSVTGPVERPIPIASYPEDPSPGLLGKQIPTESWYPDQAVARSKKRGQSGKNDLEIFAMEGYKHGYEAQRLPRFPSQCRQKYRACGHVTRMKLLLDKSPHTQGLRKELINTLEGLRKCKQITKHEDVIRDYFIELLPTVWRDMENHGLAADSEVEFIICVPVSWSPIARAILVDNLTEAIQKTDFGGPDGKKSCPIFMVNEAEAAATYVLEAGLHGLQRNDKFIIIDCGGGTNDAGTYRVSMTEPLRLSEEIINPEGILFGSSHLNDRMRDFARAELSPEPQLLENILRPDYSLEDLITQHIVIPFENEKKRLVDFRPERGKRPHFFQINGLRESQINEHIQEDFFILSHKEMLGIFMPCLCAIGALMERQIIQAEERKQDAHKVVVVGGFSDSPALQWYLRQQLERINKTRSVELIYQSICAAGVAQGGLIRAMEKMNGPKRNATLSFGFIRRWPYEPKTIRKYPELKPLRQGISTLNKLNGFKYIDDTLFWFIKVGQGEIAPFHSAKFNSEYGFLSLEEDWTVNETLYSSETCTEDHFQIEHEKNKGKVTEGQTLEINLNFLKDKVLPSYRNEKNKSGKHYVLCILMQAVLIDRDLKISARWPAKEDGQLIDISPRNISLVAAFAPGTK